MAISPIRVITGFVVAPLVVPIVMVVAGGLMSFRSGPVDQLIGQFLAYAGYAYVAALLLGVPTLFLLIRSAHTSVGILAIAGAVIGVVTTVAVLSIFGTRVFPAALVAAAAGALSALVFWAIAGLSAR
jgi:hypothetical protein